MAIWYDGEGRLSIGHIVCLHKEAEINNASFQAGGHSPPLPHPLPGSNFSPPFEFVQHGAGNRIRLLLARLPATQATALSVDTTVTALSIGNLSN